MLGRWNMRRHKGIGLYRGGGSKLHRVLKAEAMIQLFDIVREKGF